MAAHGYQMQAMPTIQDIRHANFMVLLDRFPTIQAFANAVERSHSQISQIKNRSRHSNSGEPRTIGDDLARHIEDKLALAPGWLDSPHVKDSPRSYAGDSQILVPLSVSNTPRITWGDAEMGQSLPAIFSVVIPDDSMAPRVRRGNVVRFNTALAARPGDGILVRDQQGAWYFRIYRERRPGEWEAHPLNDAYQPMDGQTNQLVILAVLTGIEEQRWG